MVKVKAHGRMSSKSMSNKDKLKTDNIKKLRKNKHITKKPGEDYKKGLLEIDKQEEKFDKLFEQKLAQQYKEFRNLKEHHNQTKKFVRIFIVLMTIILITLLLISF